MNDEHKIGVIHIVPWIYNRTLDKHQIKRWRASHCLFIVSVRQCVCKHCPRRTTVMAARRYLILKNVLKVKFLNWLYLLVLAFLMLETSKINSASTSWICFSTLILKIRLITREIDNSSYRLTKFSDVYIFQRNSCKNLYFAYVKVGYLRIIPV